MDAIVDGIPVTPRIGYAVEINALWYNAIMFALELAEKEEDTKFIKEWSHWPEIIKTSFIATFWSEKKKFLSDYVKDGECNWHVRPNQVFAVSLPYIMLSKEICKSVLDIVENELLTPRGLRTLSPNSSKYQGVYEGNQASRDNAYHQGTAWPWLLGAFCEAYLRIHKESGLQKIKDLYYGFEPELANAGIGTISEIYDGIPPHEAKGAISQAWSVAELLRIKSIIDKFEKKK
jgi:predicted glycogen debranching enzyme